MGLMSALGQKRTSTGSELNDCRARPSEWRARPRTCDTDSL